MRGHTPPFSLQKAGLLAASLGLGWMAFSYGVEWLLPRVVDFEALNRQLCQQVTETTGLRLTVQKIGVRPTLLHGLRVSLRGVTLQDSQSRMMGQARRVVVDLRYLPLLQQQGSIAKVAIQRPNVLLGENSAWFDIHLPKAAKKQIYLDNTQFGVYNARVVTNFLPGAGPTPAVLTAKAAEIEHWESPYPIRLFVKGALLVGQTQSPHPLSEFVLRAKVRQEAIAHPGLQWSDLLEGHVGLYNAHLDTISKTFEAHLPVQASGVVAHWGTTLHHPKSQAQLVSEFKTQVPITVRTSGQSIRMFPVSALVQAQLLGNPLDHDFRLDKMFLNVDSQPVALTFRGAFHPAASWDQCQLPGNIQVSKLDIAPLAKVTQFPSPMGQYLNQASGVLKARLSVSGPLMQPEVLGSVDLHNVGLKDPRSGKPLLDAVDGMVLHPTPTQWEAREVSGKLADGPFLLHGKFQQNSQAFTGRLQFNQLHLAKLKRLVTWLTPQAPVLNRVLTTGKANAFLEGHGTLKKPHLKGWVSFQHGFLALAQDKSPLVDDVTGRVRLNDQEAYAEPLVVKIGQAPVKLLGGGSSQHLQLGVDAHQVPLALVQKRLASWQVLFNQAPSPLADWRVTDGTLSSDVTLTHTLASPQMQGTLKVQNLALQHQPTKLQVAKGNLTLQGTPKGVHLQNSSAWVEGIEVRLTGDTSVDWQQVRLMAETPVFSMATVVPVVKKLVLQVDPALVASGQAQFQGFLKGALQHPDWRGALRLQNVGATYPTKKLVLTQANGQLVASPQGVEAVGLSGILNQIRFAVSGTSSFDLTRYAVALKSQDASLTALRDTVSGLFPQMQAMLDQVGLQTGTANVDVQLSSATPLVPTGHIRVNQVSARPKAWDMGVLLPQLDYDLASGQFTLPGRGLQIGDLWFKLAGHANAKGYHIKLSSERIPVATIRDNADLLTQVTMFRWPQLYNAQGEFQVEADMAPGAHQASVHFWKAGASMAGVKYPVYDLNGTLSLSLDKGLQASADHLGFRVANSPVILNLDINTLNDIYIDASGVLSPLMINDFLLSRGMTAVANVAMPFTLNASGALASFSDQGTGNNLNLFLNFDVASLFNHPQLAHPGAVHVKNQVLDNATLSSVVQLVGNVLKIEETRLKVGDQSGVMLSGQIKDLFDDAKRSMVLDAQTTPALDLAELGKEWRETIADGLEGLVTGSIQFLSNPTNTALTGTVSLSHLKSGPLAIDDLDGQVVLNGQTGQLTVNHFVIPGVDVAFTAALPNLFQYPLPMSQFDLVGNQFIITLYADWMNQILMTKIRQGFWEQFFPNTGRMGPLPFEITDGTLAIKEGVLNNLIIEDYLSTIRLYPNNYFELDKIAGRSAGGRAQGFFAMSPRDNNFMTVQMHLERMKANAVARILLNVSNQIFGDLSGDLAYTTEGMTNEEMLSHTNGSATLWIEDGRLPQIAKIENLLVAANTISGGIANLNLNSLFRMASPFNTNYFAKLTGNFKMVEGIIYTNDMKSDGRNLDLYFKGLVHMDTGVADMVLRGEMDRDIQGTLGPLGQLSFGRFLGLVPPLRMLISHIPGLGFVPGFGGPRTHKGVAFEAKIEGTAVDPGSVKSFKWVK